MGRNRLEAFSDGVLAIIITIMVLELKVPHGDQWQSLYPLLPRFLTYLMSFVYLAIYWNNHHHMMYTVKCVEGKILWANLHLLFWLSLVPFSTGWMGENDFSTIPTALYGIVLLMAGAAYRILQSAIVFEQGEHSLLKKAVGKDWKGRLSLLLYLVAIGLAYVSPWIAIGIYAVVAIMWIVPDPRIEAMIKECR